jgi:ATP-dependent Clp protease ATP-binding subunit ClpC
MFERYTEKARRVIFFARYEALQYGSPVIAPEHVLLGLVREDKSLAARYFPFANGLTVETVRKDVEDRIVFRERITQSTELQLSPETKRLLAYANEESGHLKSKHISPEHLLLGILRENDPVAGAILAQYQVRLQDVRDELSSEPVPIASSEAPHEQSEVSHLQEFTRDLTIDATHGRLDPVVGRNHEIERVIEILCRRTKNNVVLIGEAGVGKTAVIEGLAQRIVTNQVPKFLLGKKILALDLSLVVAGTKYRGQFEERLKKIMSELKGRTDCIIFVDELHTLVGAGSAEGTLDAANIMKPGLSRGEIQIVGATTPSEYRKSIERDRALERRFQAVKLTPPSEDEALQIVHGLAGKYEAFHQIRYSKEALEASVRQSNRYITDRFLPDKAIDVLDEAGARAKLRNDGGSGGSKRRRRGRFANGRQVFIEGEQLVLNFHVSDSDDHLSPEDLRIIEEAYDLTQVTRDDVEEVIARWTGIPVQSIKQEEAKKLLEIEKELHRRIISQRPAISALARAIRRSRAGLKNPNRPVGSFLFLGPTGVGKTEVARRLAEFLFGSEKSLIRFDMSEFMEKHTVAKLIGSPPGYVGHDEGGQMTEKLRRAPYSIVLFDEVEKAHPDLFNVLLQVFEDGILTDSHGTTVDCRNAIFIMTSNIGARFIQKRTALGFQSSADAADDKVEEQVMSSVRQTFAPEFINRLDEIVIFDQLGDGDLLQIVDLQVEQLNTMLRKQGLEVALTHEAKMWLVEKNCGDKSYGARPLRRGLQKYVEDDLSEALIQGHLAGESRIEISVADGKLVFGNPAVPA